MNVLTTSTPKPDKREAGAPFFLGDCTKSKVLSRFMVDNSLGKSHAITLDLMYDDLLKSGIPFLVGIAEGFRPLSPAETFAHVKGYPFDYTKMGGDEHDASWFIPSYRIPLRKYSTIRAMAKDLVDPKHNHKRLENAHGKLIDDHRDWVGEELAPPSYIMPTETPKASIAYYRLKLLKPRKIFGSPRLQKYYQPVGSGEQIFIPIGTGSRLGVVEGDDPIGNPNIAFQSGVTSLMDRARPLCIVEGEKTAVALNHQGFNVIAITGVTMGCSSLTASGLAASLSEIGVEGRRITIMFDNDILDPQKPGIIKAAAALGMALSAARANVTTRHVPSIDGQGDPYPYLGADDYLAYGESPSEYENEATHDFGSSGYQAMIDLHQRAVNKLNSTKPTHPKVLDEVARCMNRFAYQVVPNRTQPGVVDLTEPRTILSPMSFDKCVQGVGASPGGKKYAYADFAGMFTDDELESSGMKLIPPNFKKDIYETTNKVNTNLSVFKLLWKTGRLRHIKGVVFDPTNPAKLIPEVVGNLTNYDIDQSRPTYLYNTFVLPAVYSGKGALKEDVALAKRYVASFEEVIDFTLAMESPEVRYVLFKHLLNALDLSTGRALLVYNFVSQAQGSGKSTLATICASMWSAMEFYSDGTHEAGTGMPGVTLLPLDTNIRSTSGLVQERFNTLTQSCLGIVYNEAYLNATDHAGRANWKATITEATMAYEGKGVDKVVSANLSQIYVTLNSAKALPYEPEDRRNNWIQLPEKSDAVWAAKPDVGKFKDAIMVNYNKVCRYYFKQYLIKEVEKYESAMADDEPKYHAEYLLPDSYGAKVHREAHNTIHDELLQGLWENPRDTLYASLHNTNKPKLHYGASVRCETCEGCKYCGPKASKQNALVSNAEPEIELTLFSRVGLQRFFELNIPHTYRAREELDAAMEKVNMQTSKTENGTQVVMYCQELIDLYHYSPQDADTPATAKRNADRSKALTVAFRAQRKMRNVAKLAAKSDSISED